MNIMNFFKDFHQFLDQYPLWKLTFTILVVVVEGAGEMLVHLAGSVPRIVGEHDAGGREILSLPLAAAAVAGTATATAAAQRHIQSGQFLGNGTCPAAAASSATSAATANARGTRTARR